MEKDDDMIFQGFSRLFYDFACTGGRMGITKPETPPLPAL
jgi:hypothetical protein